MVLARKHVVFLFGKSFLNTHKGAVYFEQIMIFKTIILACVLAWVKENWVSVNCVQVLDAGFRIDSVCKHLEPLQHSTGKQLPYNARDFYN